MIIARMVLNMNDGRLTAIEQKARFLGASRGVAFPAASDDGERYLHSSRVLKRFLATQEAPPGMRKTIPRNRPLAAVAMIQASTPNAMAWSAPLPLGTQRKPRTHASSGCVDC